MKKIALLFTLLLSTVYGFAAVIEGHVFNMSSSPVVGQLVHITDTSGGVQVFALTDSTDASGHYSITIPGTTPTGAPLHVFTEKCGVKSTSLQTWAGSSITVNFTVCGTTATDTVSGRVTYNSPTGYPAYPANVFLIKKSYNSSTASYNLSLVDSTITNSNGEYHFYGVSLAAGDLLVKAALTTGNSQYWNYLPTYKENSISWSTAHAVSFTLGANDIHMVAGTNPGGPGFIGGSVLLGANKSSGVGDPLESRIVLLTTDQDIAVAYTFSDASGHFSFSNLAYGSYKLFGDALGKNNPVLLVTIDGSHPSIGSIIFQENSQNFTALKVSNPVLFNLVAVYPNPVSDVLSVTGLNSITGVKTILVQDMSGRIVWSSTSNEDHASIPMKAMASGIYQLMIRTDAGSGSFQIIH